MEEDPASGGDAVADDALPWQFPSHPVDGWEPGAPSVRGLLPSVVGGAVVPIVVFFVVRRHVGGDAPALAIAGIPAAAWVLVEGVRRRTLDPIGSIVLLGFIAGITASWALGGNAFVLKVRDAVFTSVIGIASLLSLAFARKPLMFHIGRGLSAGGDPERRQLFDQLWEIPPSRAVFRLLTVVWGVGLLFDAVAKVLAAVVLPTSAFVVVNPILSIVVLGSLFFFTIWFSRWSRVRFERIATDVPAGGGTTLWWLRALVK
ncbi:MAG: VC0807 family protein [Acidimicrobiales bacterium]